MFEVRNSKGEVIAFATRKEDAEALTKTKLDKEDYTCSQTSSSQIAQSQQS